MWVHVDTNLPFTAITKSFLTNQFIISLFNWEVNSIPFDWHSSDSIFICKLAMKWSHNNAKIVNAINLFHRDCTGGSFFLSNTAPTIQCAQTCETNTICGEVQVPSDHLKVIMIHITCVCISYYYWNHSSEVYWM